MHRSCDPAPLLPCCPPLAPACLCFGSGSQVPAALPPSFAPDWPACALLCRFPPPLPPQALLSQVRGLSPSTLTCGPPVRHTHTKTPRAAPAASPPATLPAPPPPRRATPLVSVCAALGCPPSCFRSLVPTAVGSPPAPSCLPCTLRLGSPACLAALASSCAGAGTPSALACCPGLPRACTIARRLCVVVPGRRCAACG